MIVTFWLPAVVSVKPDADTLLAVPIEPPAAGPERALDPLPTPEPPARVLAAIRLCPLAATKMAMVVITESEQVACTARCESAAYRLGSDRGSPNQGSALFSNRVMAQIRSPARVRT